MKVKGVKWLLVSCVAVVVLSSFLLTAYSQRQIRWGTSVLGAGSQALLATIINTVDKADPDIGVVEQTTSGPLENVRLLSQGLIEIAQTTSSDAWNGYFGSGSFSSQGPVKMMGLFGIYPANMTFAVLEDSGIQKISDLKDKRIAVGPPGAGSSVIMTAWAKAYLGDSPKYIRLGYREGADALRNGTVEAALVYGIGPVAVGYLKELDLAVDLRILGWDVSGSEYEKLRKDHPEVAIVGTFSKECSKGLDQDVQVPTTYSAEYADKRLSEENAYRILNALWENRQQILDANKLAHWMLSDPENMLQGLAHPEIPVHPGAARFYKERGVWKDTYTVGTLD